MNSRLGSCRPANFFSKLYYRREMHRVPKKFFAARFLPLFVALFTAVSSHGCAYGRLETANIRIERGAEQPLSIRAELARSVEERQQGLMHRKKLADGAGMLFIFDRDQVLSFWMKNTYVPLSIAFIAADGRIVEIKDMQPLDLNTVSSSRSVRYALEVPQGWFGRANINPGDRLVLDEIIGRTKN